MNSSAPNPKLPMWIFIATDLALIGTAALLAATSTTPYSATVMLAIVVCLSLGAIVGLVPIVLFYERQKNEALDERQRALEALARTVSSSAEQLSIATSGLHQTAELALKNLRMAEHLPHKLQEKVAEFQAQLTTTVDAEKEELERELLALRTSESERLETVSQRIAKSAAEWTKLEASTHQQLTAANEAVAKLALGTAGAIGKAQAAAEQALAQARAEAARGVGEVSGQGVRTIEIAKTAALAELDAKIAAAADAIVQRVTAALGQRPLPPSASREAAPTATPASNDMASANAALPVENTASDSAAAKESVPPPKRPRKIRREETAGGEPSAPGSSPAPSSASPEAPTAAAPVEEPHPVPAQTIPEVAPVAPATAEPFSHHVGSTKNGSASPDSEAAPMTTTAVATAPAPRKRAARAVAVDEEPGLGLALDDSSSASMSEGVLSSDGATRLLVTAYIGIGNRLFIRGSGPGLTWEKGVPLQFVSIGKWRWETNEASAPVQFKLYKNDDLECAALGQQSVEPGRQQEVTAAF